MNKIAVYKDRSGANVKHTLQRLRSVAPNIYNEAILLHRRKNKRGLGEVDWSKVGESLIDTIALVKANKEISESERKAAELELRKMQEANAALAQQLQLKKDLLEAETGLTVAQRASMFGGSFVDQLIAKPWAIPALAGLTGLLIFKPWKKKSRARRR